MDLANVVYYLAGLLLAYTYGMFNIPCKFWGFFLNYFNQDLKLTKTLYVDLIYVLRPVKFWNIFFRTRNVLLSLHLDSADCFKYILFKKSNLNTSFFEMFLENDLYVMKKNYSSLVRICKQNNIVCC